MERIEYRAPQGTQATDVYEEVRNIVQRKGLEPHEAIEVGKMLSENYRMYDDSYLKALLFPEDSEACRIPSKFPMSTANATQTWSFYVNTGNTGMGHVTVLPLDLAYRVAYQSMPDYDGNPSNSGAYKHQYINETSNDDITKYYAQGRIVGCSVRAQYIGEAMSESGLMFGSHVFDSTLGRISEDVIENGYYITRGRPHEGIRLAYLPRDEGDLEYCGLDYKVYHNSGDGIVVPKYDYNNYPELNGQLQVQVFQPDLQEFVVEQGAVQGGPQVFFKRPDQYIGQTCKRGQSNTPYQMVIGWVGMPPSKDWIRIDIVRHLEVIPRMQLRDLISTKKTQADAKTVELVQHIAEVDARPMSNTIGRHEEAVAAHANLSAGDTVGLAHQGNRQKSAGSWIGNIMKKLVGTGMQVGGTILGTVGGGWGKAIGAGLNYVGGRINSTDNYTGGRKQYSKRREPENEVLREKSKAEHQKYLDSNLAMIKTKNKIEEIFQSVYFGEYQKIPEYIRAGSEEQPGFLISRYLVYKWIKQDKATFDTLKTAERILIRKYAFQASRQLTDMNAILDYFFLMLDHPLGIKSFSVAYPDLKSQFNRSSDLKDLLSSIIRLDVYGTARQQLESVNLGVKILVKMKEYEAEAALLKPIKPTKPNAPEIKPPPKKVLGKRHRDTIRDKIEEIKEQITYTQTKLQISEKIIPTEEPLPIYIKPEGYEPWEIGDTIYPYSYDMRFFEMGLGLEAKDFLWTEGQRSNFIPLYKVHPYIWMMEPYSKLIDKRFIKENVGDNQDEQATYEKWVRLLGYEKEKYEIMMGTHKTITKSYIEKINERKALQKITKPVYIAKSKQKTFDDYEGEWKDYMKRLKELYSDHLVQQITPKELTKYKETFMEGYGIATKDLENKLQAMQQIQKNQTKEVKELFGAIEAADDEFARQIGELQELVEASILQSEIENSFSVKGLSDITKELLKQSKKPKRTPKKNKLISKEIEQKLDKEEEKIEEEVKESLKTLSEGTGQIAEDDSQGGFVTDMRQMQPGLGENPKKGAGIQAKLIYTAPGGDKRPLGILKTLNMKERVIKVTKILKKRNEYQQFVRKNFEKAKRLKTLTEQKMLSKRHINAVNRVIKKERGIPKQLTIKEAFYRIGSIIPPKPGQILISTQAPPKIYATRGAFLVQQNREAIRRAEDDPETTVRAFQPEEIKVKVEEIYEAVQQKEEDDTHQINTSSVREPEIEIVPLPPRKVISQYLPPVNLDDLTPAELLLYSNAAKVALIDYSKINHSKGESTLEEDIARIKEVALDPEGPSYRPKYIDYDDRGPQIKWNNNPPEERVRKRTNVTYQEAKITAAETIQKEFDSMKKYLLPEENILLDARETIVEDTKNTTIASVPNVPDVPKRRQIVWDDVEYDKMLRPHKYPMKPPPPVPKRKKEPKNLMDDLRESDDEAGMEDEPLPELPKPRIVPTEEEKKRLEPINIAERKGIFPKHFYTESNELPLERVIKQLRILTAELYPRANDEKLRKEYGQPALFPSENETASWIYRITELNHKYLSPFYDELSYERIDEAGNFTGIRYIPIMTPGMIHTVVAKMLKKMEEELVVQKNLKEEQRKINEQYAQMKIPETMERHKDEQQLRDEAMLIARTREIQRGSLSAIDYKFRANPAKVIHKGTGLVQYAMIRNDMLSNAERKRDKLIKKIAKNTKANLIAGPGKMKLAVKADYELERQLNNTIRDINELQQSYAKDDSGRTYSFIKTEKEWERGKRKELRAMIRKQHAKWLESIDTDDEVNDKFHNTYVFKRLKDLTKQHTLPEMADAIIHTAEKFRTEYSVTDSLNAYQLEKLREQKLKGNLVLEYQNKRLIKWIERLLVNLTVQKNLAFDVLRIIWRVIIANIFKFQYKCVLAVTRQNDIEFWRREELATEESLTFIKEKILKPWIIVCLKAFTKVKVHHNENGLNLINRLIKRINSYPQYSVLTEAFNYPTIYLEIFKYIGQWDSKIDVSKATSFQYELSNGLIQTLAFSEDQLGELQIQQKRLVHISLTQIALVSLQLFFKQNNYVANG